MRFYIVDAFTDQIFGGNSAGVVVLPAERNFPSDVLMKKIAGELRYSETVFVKRLDDRRLKLRYFTPVEEVDLCGHGTVGAFYALLEEGDLKDNSSYLAETGAGDLNVELKKQMVMMDMAMPESGAIIRNCDDIRDLYGIMGIKNPVQVSLEGEWDLYPEIISTGLSDIILPVENKKTLMEINPDFKALSIISKKYKGRGTHNRRYG